MRTKGATSNIAVKLSQLNSVLQPGAIVWIARRQAAELHLIGVATYATDDNLKAVGNPPAIEEKVTFREVVEEDETLIDTNE